MSEFDEPESQMREEDNKASLVEEDNLHDDDLTSLVFFQRKSNLKRQRNCSISPDTRMVQSSISPFGHQMSGKFEDRPRFKHDLSL